MRNVLFVVVAFVTSCFFLGCATPAELFEQGRRYYSANDIERAKECLKESADRGHVEARFLLGRIYYGEESFGLAVKYLGGAVGAGCAQAKELYGKASFALGLEYYNMNKFRRSFTPFEMEMAATCFKQAMNAGHAQSKEWYGKAIFALGQHYYTANDFKTAAKHFEKAADAGHRDAQEMLGYKNGRKPDVSRISFEKRLACIKAYARLYEK